MSRYQALITATLAVLGRPNISARHVEGWMRSENPTLDSLSRTKFVDEVAFAVSIIEGPDGKFSEDVARSFGL